MVSKVYSNIENTWKHIFPTLLGRFFFLPNRKNLYEVNLHNIGFPLRMPSDGFICSSFCCSFPGVFFFSDEKTWRKNRGGMENSTISNHWWPLTSILEDKFQVQRAYEICPSSQSKNRQTKHVKMVKLCKAGATEVVFTNSNLNLNRNSALWRAKSFWDHSNRLAKLSFLKSSTHLKNMSQNG